MKELKACGLKVTKTRIAILKTLKDAPLALTAEDIYSALVRQGEKISLSTIYRCLTVFCEHKLVRIVSSLHGVASYQWHGNSHHHHIVCSQCQKDIVLEDCPLGEMEKSLHEKTGFLITGHHLEFVGLCPDCQKDAGNPSENSSSLP